MVNRPPILVEERLIQVFITPDGKEYRTRADAAVAYSRILADAYAARTIAFRRQRVRELNAEGRLDVEIAAELGVSPATIFQDRRKLGLSRSPSSFKR